MDYIVNKGSAHADVSGFSEHSDNKLNVTDWVSGVPDSKEASSYVEVQFKNTRKGYYLNEDHLPLKKGDMVTVESNPGHDIGKVSLTGKLVLLQMIKNRVRKDSDIRKIYRISRPADMEKYEEAKAKEHETMIRSRKIAASLGLRMKIGDVEYQGDGNKAIFYYIADERVDFRQLIKDLAMTFRLRIEMKQIGARQEAGRIGGIGPCGRELCCSSWITGFSSVSTAAARLQDISMNPQKLAGLCAKLKCCINYEVNGYVEARKCLPSRELTLETKDSTYYHFKTDIFKHEITYSTGKNMVANLVTIPAQRAFEVYNMNKKGEKPETLEANETQKPVARDAKDILDQDLTRFDSSMGKKKKKRTKRTSTAVENGAKNRNESETEIDKAPDKKAKKNVEDKKTKPRIIRKPRRLVAKKETKVEEGEPNSQQEMKPQEKQVKTRQPRQNVNRRRRPQRPRTDRQKPSDTPKNSTAKDND
ncbi:MAG: hypothetical protein M0P33_01480 [Massilibacteroides sp.]|nr:hypothetical protein [Massilibacteroides sp.]